MVKSVFDRIDDRKTDQEILLLPITLFRVQRLAAIRMHFYEKDPINKKKKNY